jgi:branched-chain amino acid aminotransferase
MSTPVLSSEDWYEKLMSLPRMGAGSVTAFYEHRMGGICLEPRFLLAPMDDHMVHRGDAVFESLAFRNGGIVQLDAHIERMKHSAERLFLVPPLSWEELRATALDVARAGGEPYGGLKILLGRGCGGLGVDPKECPQSSLYMIATKGTPLPESFWEKGLTAARSSVPAKQPWLAQIKSTNYLANAMMAREAGEMGVSMPFSFDSHGFLAEAAVANVGMVDDAGRLLIPEFRCALPGTTAILAEEVASSFMPVLHMDITEAMLEAASEIVVFGTTPECVAVTQYNGRPINGGVPGPVAKKLRRMLHDALLERATPFMVR